MRHDGRQNDRGAWGDTLPTDAESRWNALAGRYEAIIAKHPKAKAFNTHNPLSVLLGAVFSTLSGQS